MDVLNFLASHATQQFTLTEIAQALDINLASLHGVLGVMADMGYVIRHPSHRTYQLGPTIIALGNAALETHPVIGIAIDESAKLAKSSKLEVLVVAPAGGHMVVLARLGGAPLRGVHTASGQRIPLRPPVGAVFYAWATEEDVAEWLGRLHIASPADRERYEQVLAATRTRGYSVGLRIAERPQLYRALRALQDHPFSDDSMRDVGRVVDEMEPRPEAVLVDVDPEAQYDLDFVAAPIFGPRGEAVLALYALAHRNPLDGRAIASLGEDVVDAAAVITTLSHGRLPPRVGFQPAPS